MKNLITLLLLLSLNMLYLPPNSQQSICQTDEFKVHLTPINIGVPNLQTPANYPVAGFGRRQTEDVWVPFQFEIPDHTGLEVKEAFLYVVIEALDANGDGIADADFYTDTVEGCGENGREDGVGLFKSFPSLYSAGENPLTAKTIKIDLMLFSKILDVLNFEKILHALSEDDHSVLDAWLDIIFGPPGPAKVNIKNATKIPKINEAFKTIPAQIPAGNFPAIPRQEGNEIIYSISFDVELKEQNGDRGPVFVQIQDFLPPGMTFKRFYATDPATTNPNVTNGIITFNQMRLELPDDGSTSKTFTIRAIYSVTIDADADVQNYLQNNASVVISDAATGVNILTRPIQGRNITALYPKLHLDKFTSTYSVNAGDEVTFTIVARNEGNIYFESLDLDAIIPDGVTVDQASIYPTPFTIVGNRIQWRNFGPINTGVSEGFSYRVRVDANTPNETNLTDLGYATIRTPNIDGAGSRNLNAVSNIISVKVTNQPINASIGVTLTATPNDGVYPMYINYSSDVTNTGEVELRDVSLALTQGTLPLAGNPDFPVSLGTLQPGESKTVKYKGQIGPRQVGDLIDLVLATGNAYRNGVILNIPPVTARANVTVTVLFPAVTHVTPSAEAQGAKNLLLKIEGINFSPGYSYGTGLSFDPDVGIEIIPPESPGYGFVDFTELNYHVNIADDAPIGEYEVFVTSPNSYTGKSSEGNGITVTGEIKEPEVTTISPVGATRQIQDIDLVITGGNFTLDASVEFGGSGIILNETKVLSSHKIKVSINITETATIGFVDVIVTNPNGKQGIGENLFEVIESLGNVELTWNRPIPGLDLAPPTNLITQHVGGPEQLSKNSFQSNLIQIRMPKRGYLPMVNKTHLNHSILGDSSDVILEIEPNNSFSQAQVLSGDSSIFVDGNIEVNDNGNIVVNGDAENDDIEDLFKFTITEPGLEVYLWGFSSDCDLYLFNQPDSNGLIGWSKFTVIDGEEIIIDYELPAGTYYIGVSIVDSNPQGPETSYYGLDIFGVFGDEIIIPVVDNKLKSFNVYRSLSGRAERSGTVIARVDTNTTSYLDYLQTKENYYYQVTADYGFGESLPSNESSIILTSIDDYKNDQLQTKFKLFTNYPNPFNPVTTLSFSLPLKSNVDLVIYNILGAKVKSIIKNEEMEAGIHNITFYGQNFATGVYFVRLRAGDYSSVKKIMLLK